MACGDYSEPCCSGGCTNADSFCENGVCIQCGHQGQECCSDLSQIGAGCAQGLSCISGLCQGAQTISCQANTDCLLNGICVSGTCFAPPLAQPTNWGAILAGVGLALSLGGLAYPESKRGYY